MTQLQPLLKASQASIIPAPRLAYDQDQEDQANTFFDPSLGGSVYDEAGNDLMAQAPNPAQGNHELSEPNFATNDAPINDNCTMLGLSVYADYGIANVALSEHWRVYPNDDNLQKLKELISEDNLHFHYS